MITLQFCVLQIQLCETFLHNCQTFDTKWTLSNEDPPGRSGHIACASVEGAQEVWATAIWDPGLHVQTLSFASLLPFKQCQCTGHRAMWPCEAGWDEETDGYRQGWWLVQNVPASHQRIDQMQVSWHQTSSRRFLEFEPGKTEWWVCLIHDTQ